MQQVSGLLTKISDRQYRLVTMENELLIEGDLSHSDGFHSNIDLGNVLVSERQMEKVVASGLYMQNAGIEASECLDLSDDCTVKDDCDCECADCVAP